MIFALDMIACVLNTCSSFFFRQAFESMRLLRDRFGHRSCYLLEINHYESSIVRPEI